MKKITLLLLFLMAFAVKSWAQFPAPYCAPSNFTYVEPISYVNFAGIDNTSPAATTSPAHENFLNITASVDAGGTYPIVVKGNTGGNYSTYVRAYFDWNQNNVFTDAGEAYDIGIILNSSGTDAIQITANITVPGSALAGTTRMRLIKAYAAYTDSCNTSGSLFGQAEDYSVAVVLPSCAAPSMGMATVTSATTANLTWTSSVPDGEIVVQPATAGPPAAADGTGVTVSGTSYSATGLTPATLYEFYIRNECVAGTGFSSWAGPFAFDTTIAPGCASNPTPADGAIDVPFGPVTLTWDVPTTGDPATSYDVYAGNTAATLALVGNYPTNTTGTDLTINAYNAVIYWQVRPKNSGGTAMDCPIWSFTTEASPGYCLNAANGQWPGGVAGYTPPNCDGITTHNITTSGFASEYSLVNVTLGQTYSFTSSVITDYITIGTADGLMMITSGATPLTWVSDVAGQIRFYTHTSNQCGAASVNRTRAVKCGVLSTETPDYVNLQYPATITVSQGNSEMVYGRVYEAGLTDVAPNIDGQAPGITAWVGISPIGANTDPATWTMWIPAAHNPAFMTNDDEYMASIGGNLAPGTYYYATRFRLGSGPYVYGGYPNGFWNGTTQMSGVLTVTPPPAPANDECAAAVALTPGGIFDDYNIATTNVGAGVNATNPLPTCGAVNFATTGKDVWYSVVVPASGSVTVATGTNGGTMADTVMELYSGTCGALTMISCNDDIIPFEDSFSTISVTGRTPGEVLLVRIWGYNGSSGGYDISAFDASLSTDSFLNANFKYFPNPVKDVLTLSHSENITSASVFNILGQQVLFKSINGTQGSLDMSTLASGAYIVKVAANNAVKTIKVIKE